MGNDIFEEIFDQVSSLNDKQIVKETDTACESCITLASIEILSDYLDLIERIGNIFSQTPTQAIATAERMNAYLRIFGWPSNGAK
jgi:hypothetical protein